MSENPSLRPAILGGSKAVTLDGTAANRWPILTDEEEAAVLEVLRSGDLSQHPVTRMLEDDYRQYFGVRHALAHCNGTLALFAAFFSLDLHPGDEVLVPSATFWASVVPMLWLGAIPIFCETEPQQLGLDPEDVLQKITPRTRAMVVVHLWGMPSKMTGLLEIAERYGLQVVEDASHAQGARWHGRLCGTLGHISVFSLQTSKLAPAGEGGMLLTNDDRYIERAICLGDIERILELKSPARRLAGTSFGLKTRMAPLSAAIARVQLRRLAERNARRNENLRYLSDHLEILGFHTFLPPADVERVYFEYLVRYDARRSGMPIEVLVDALVAEGCDITWPRYPLLHQQPLFTEELFARIARLDRRSEVPWPIYRPDALPRTETASRELLRLPTFPLGGRDLLDQYVNAFEKVLGHSAEIMAAREKAKLPAAG